MSNRRYSTITGAEADSLLQSRLAELRRLQEIESLTNRMAKLLQALNHQITLMQLGTSSVADVTANWIQIVRAVSLAANSMMVYNEEDFKNGLPTTERLVRCALNDIGAIVSNLSEEQDGGKSETSEET
ncbi:hypothetical protein PICMEDRAFT_10471 [Pichia membranifaciens NRRL Y-2026]|uniref:DASH complex subunit DAD2 n=1 Tax=Pichia membranifaciens NRRL Y-2026 TaxID=763406 RepID=A0A1E3NMY3_9ASCO|nr:hypothetical protein PICMEDRAFT_10471 [Pichia membranifaciens NRRL Y-2026]ODQ47474.1 hypothetical protein PICMEDRAFT_10471 [Pichia membranifaciens NRRL Y-2026]